MLNLFSGHQMLGYKTPQIFSSATFYFPLQKSSSSRRGIGNRLCQTMQAITQRTGFPRPTNFSQRSSQMLQRPQLGRLRYPGRPYPRRIQRCLRSPNHSTRTHPRPFIQPAHATATPKRGLLEKLAAQPVPDRLMVLESEMQDLWKANKTVQESLEDIQARLCAKEKLRLPHPASRGHHG